MKDIIHQVIESGGIPILIHTYGQSMNEREIEQMIEEFSWLAGQECFDRFGSLDVMPAGVEVYYERYVADLERMRFLKDMQQRYGLLASASGDRHRDGQPFCTGGDMELLEAMLAAIHGK